MKRIAALALTLLLSGCGGSGVLYSQRETIVIGGQRDPEDTGTVNLEEDGQ